LFNVEKKAVFGWFDSRSFAEILFKEMVAQIQEVKYILFLRKKFSDEENLG